MAHDLFGDTALKQALNTAPTVRRKHQQRRTATQLPPRGLTTQVPAQSNTHSSVIGGFALVISRWNRVGQVCGDGGLVVTVRVC